MPTKTISTERIRQHNIVLLVGKHTLFFLRMLYHPSEGRVSEEGLVISAQAHLSRGRSVIISEEAGGHAASAHHS